MEALCWQGVALAFLFRTRNCTRIGLERAILSMVNSSNQHLLPTELGPNAAYNVHERSIEDRGRLIGPG